MTAGLRTPSCGIIVRATPSGDIIPCCLKNHPLQVGELSDERETDARYIRVFPQDATVLARALNTSASVFPARFSM
jgi:hypothetical protein